MKRSPIDKIKRVLKIKHGATAIEYGVIVAFVSVTAVVSSQLSEAAGFSSLNRALNAVSVDSVSGDNTFKAD